MADHVIERATPRVASLDRYSPAVLLSLAFAFGILAQYLFYRSALGINVGIASLVILAIAWRLRPTGARVDPLDRWIVPAAVSPRMRAVHWTRSTLRASATARCRRSSNTFRASTDRIERRWALPFDWPRCRGAISRRRRSRVSASIASVLVKPSSRWSMSSARTRRFAADTSDSDSRPYRQAS